MKKQIVSILALFVFTFLINLSINHSESIFYERMSKDTKTFVKALDLPAEQSNEMVANMSFLRVNISAYVSGVTSAIVFGFGFLLIIIISINRSEVRKNDSQGKGE